MFKVIIVVNDAKSIVLFRWQLLIDLKINGAEVIVCAPDYEKNIKLKLCDNGIRFQQSSMNRTSLNPIREFSSLLWFYRFYKREKPNIVLNYTLKPIIYSSIACFLVKTPFVVSVVTGFGSIFLGTEIKNKLLRLFIGPLRWFGLKLNHRVFVLNSDIMRSLNRQKLRSPKKFVLIDGEGLDVNHYKFVPSPDLRYPVFLMISRLIRDKGVYEYASAAKKVKKKYPQVRFLIVGCLDANPTALTKKELELLIADGAIEYLGWIDDVREVIANSSVFILPSYAEGMPRAVLEAMAIGRPIITTYAPGCRETVIEDVNGYLVPIKNVEGLAEAMEKFILHPELVIKMGIASRQIAEEKYDVYKINQVILREINVLSAKASNRLTSF